MIELYVWKYPLGDEYHYDFARVDSFDEETDPFNDEETPDPTGQIWVTESVYEAYCNASVVVETLQDRLLLDGERWKGLRRTT